MPDVDSSQSTQMGMGEERRILGTLKFSNLKVGKCFLTFPFHKRTNLKRLLNYRNE